MERPEGDRGTKKDLVIYRLKTSKETLKSAKILFAAEEYKGANNRAYYAIFHAMRSVLALDGLDSSKHSGIIAIFNEKYVRMGNFEGGISKVIASAYRLRERADYQDFFIVTEQEAVEQIKKAEKILGMVEKYLEERRKN